MRVLPGGAALPSEVPARSGPAHPLWSPCRRQRPVVGGAEDAGASSLPVYLTETPVQMQTASLAPPAWAWLQDGRAK